jgi:formate dehydrogenase major subunit
MGSDTSTAISNLLLTSGNYMRPGTGAYPLRGHNNVQGASDHGAMPNYFPGYQKVDALGKLDFFVMQDIFFTETCRFADVILPASPSLEKEGTFTSTERRIQRLYQVLDPLGQSRPDWKIIQEIANRLGAGWNYKDPSEICDEIASLTPIMAGVNYARLEGYRFLEVLGTELNLRGKAGPKHS